MSGSCHPWTVACQAPLFLRFSRQEARILEWVAISFSRGSSQPWNRTQVSCIAGRFFPNSNHICIHISPAFWISFLIAPVIWKRLPIPVLSSSCCLFLSLPSSILLIWQVPCSVALPLRGLLWPTGGISHFSLGAPTIPWSFSVMRAACPTGCNELSVSSVHVGVLWALRSCLSSLWAVPETS